VETDDVDDDQYCVSPANFPTLLIGTPGIRNICLANLKSLIKTKKYSKGNI